MDYRRQKAHVTCLKKFKYGSMTKYSQKVLVFFFTAICQRKFQIVNNSITRDLLDWKIEHKMFIWTTAEFSTFRMIWIKFLLVNIYLYNKLSLIYSFKSINLEVTGWTQWLRLFFSIIFPISKPRFNMLLL